MNYFTVMTIGILTSVTLSLILVVLLMFSAQMFMNATDKIKRFAWYSHSSRSAIFWYTVRAYGKASLLSLMSPVVALPIFMRQRTEMRKRYSIS